MSRQGLGRGFGKSNLEYPPPYLSVCSLRSTLPLPLFSRPWMYRRLRTYTGNLSLHPDTTARVSSGIAKDWVYSPIALLMYGSSSHPEPFECAITPRSPEAVATLHHAIDNEQWNAESSCRIYPRVLRYDSNKTWALLLSSLFWLFVLYVNISVYQIDPLFFEVDYSHSLQLLWRVMSIMVDFIEGLQAYANIHNLVNSVFTVYLSYVLQYKQPEYSHYGYFISFIACPGTDKFSHVPKLWGMQS